MGHGLPELGLAAGMFDEVDLVHHIDEAVGFRDAPEHLADAETCLPAAGGAEPAVEQQIGLPHVEVASPRVRIVVAEEGRNGEGRAVGPVHVERRFGDGPGDERLLAGEHGGQQEHAALGAHAA